MASNLQDQDPVEPEIRGQHEAARRIGLDHVRVRAVVAAPGKTARGRAAGAVRAESTVMALYIAGRAELAVRPDRKHCRSSAVVIRHEHPLARLVQTQVARAGAFRRHRVHQLEPPFGALDLVRAYRPSGHTLATFPLRIQKAALERPDASR